MFLLVAVVPFAAAWWLGVGSAPAVDRPIRQSAQPPSAPAAAPVAPETASQPHASRRAATPRVVFTARDAQDDRALDGVAVAVVSLAKRNPLQSRTPLPGLTRDGVLEIPRHRFLELIASVERAGVAFSHPRRSIRILPAAQDISTYEARLEPCSSVQVACVDGGGRPIEGVRVFVSKSPFARGKRLDALAASQFLPSHHGSMAVAVSDHTGFAEIADLPPGRYCAWASHPNYAPVERNWQSRAYLEVGRSRVIECRMAPLVALWAAVPRRGVAKTRLSTSDKRVTFPLALDTHLWRIANDLRTTPSYLDPAEMQLVARVGVLLDEADANPIDATVAWQGYDGVWESARLRYEPLDVVRENGPRVFRSQRALPFPARLTVELRDSRGTALAGVPLHLVAIESPSEPGSRHRRLPTIVECRSGEEQPLIAGKWRIEPARNLCGRIAGETVVECRAATATIAKLSAQDALREVRLTVPETDMLYPSVAVDVFVGERHVGGQALTGENLLPMWLPVGECRVDYRLGGEALRSIQLSVQSDSKALVVPLSRAP